MAAEYDNPTYSSEKIHFHNKESFIHNKQKSCPFSRRNEVHEGSAASIVLKQSTEISQQSDFGDGHQAIQAPISSIKHPVQQPSPAVQKNVVSQKSPVKVYSSNVHNLVPAVKLIETVDQKSSLDHTVLYMLVKSPELKKTDQTLPSTENSAFPLERLSESRSSQEIDKAVKSLMLTSSINDSSHAQLFNIQNIQSSVTIETTEQGSQSLHSNPGSIESIESGSQPLDSTSDGLIPQKHHFKSSSEDESQVLENRFKPINQALKFLKPNEESDMNFELILHIIKDQKLFTGRRSKSSLDKNGGCHLNSTPTKLCRIEPKKNSNPSDTEDDGEIGQLINQALFYLKPEGKDMNKEDEPESETQALFYLKPEGKDMNMEDEPESETHLKKKPKPKRKMIGRKKSRHPCPLAFEQLDIEAQEALVLSHVHSTAGESGTKIGLQSAGAVATSEDKGEIGQLINQGPFLFFSKPVVKDIEGEPEIEMPKTHLKKKHQSAGVVATHESCNKPAGTLPIWWECNRTLTGSKVEPNIMRSISRILQHDLDFIRTKGQNWEFIDQGSHFLNSDGTTKPAEAINELRNDSRTPFQTYPGQNSVDEKGMLLMNLEVNQQTGGSNEDKDIRGGGEIINQALLYLRPTSGTCHLTERELIQFVNSAMESNEKGEFLKHVSLALQTSLKINF
jgi:hypothetical protein